MEQGLATAGRIVVAAAGAFARTAAGELAAVIRDVASADRRVTLALAGGATPRPVYAQLAGDRTVPWHRVHVYFGDERCVAPDDPDSNYRMARETLIEAAGIPPGRVHRIEAERPDREAAALDYGRILPDKLDILVLGIGEDGHTAALFPGSAALRERRAKVMPVTGAKPPHDRMTITPIVIQAAATIVVMATGAGKAQAVARALRGPADVPGCPAQLARRGLWLLDGEAAAGLGTSSGKDTGAGQPTTNS